MNYTAETIGGYLKWYEILGDIGNWMKLAELRPLDNNVLKDLSKLSETLRALQLKRPYKAKLSSVTENMFSVEHLIMFEKAGFINLEVDEKNDAVVIAPRFLDIKNNVRVTKKIVNISPAAIELYNLFYETQGKYLKMRHRRSDWQKEFQQMLKNVPFSHIQEIIVNLPKMDFWYDKVLSPKGLRKHYNQLDREWNKLQKNKKDIKPKYTNVKLDTM